MVRGLKDNILLTQCNEFLENFFMGWMMEDKALGVEELSAVALGTSLPFIIWCVCVCVLCVSGHFQALKHRTVKGTMNYSAYRACFGKIENTVSGISTFSAETIQLFGFFLGGGTHFGGLCPCLCPAS